MTSDQFAFLVTMLSELRLLIGVLGGLCAGLLTCLCVIAGWKR